METYTREQVEIALKVEFNRGFREGYEQAIENHGINTAILDKEKP